jgi:hypothetical protein
MNLITLILKKPIGFKKKMFFAGTKIYVSRLENTIEPFYLFDDQGCYVTVLICSDYYNCLMENSSIILK